MAVIPQQILSYLTGTLGYSPTQAAALAGNMEQESGFNPNSLNKNEGAFGLLQWRGPRLEALNRFAAARGVSPSDWRTQLDFTRYEMGGSEGKSAAPFLAASSVPQANAALHGYIRYGDNSEGTRLRNTQNFAGLDPSYNGFNAPPLMPGTQAPALPPPINVASNTIADPFSAPQFPPAAGAQTPAQSPSFNPLAMLSGLGGGSAKQNDQPVQPPQIAPNPIQAMAMMQPPPNTQGLQQLLSKAPVLRGLIV